MISAKHSAGACLEGTTAVALEIGPKTQLLYRLRQQLHLPPDKLCQTPFQGSKRKQPDASLRVQFDGKINIASRIRVAPRDRSEQRKVSDTRLPELRLMRLQRGYHMLGDIRHRAHRGPSDHQEYHERRYCGIATALNAATSASVSGSATERPSAADCSPAAIVAISAIASAGGTGFGPKPRIASRTAS